MALGTAMESGERAETRASSGIWRRVDAAVYALCIAVSIGTWFKAIGVPLWLDEEGSYWIIEKGFWQIGARAGHYGFPAYYWVLWAATRVLGTSEVAMRIPSLLAMLGAAWLVWLAARELFEREVAAIAVVVFCLHPAAVFVATDARPYALATLMTAAAVVLLLRLRRDGRMRTAALMGLAAAVAVWFHLLFGAIAPALGVCILAGKGANAKARWRQFGAAAGAFVVGIAPVVPELVWNMRTGKEHVFIAPPRWVSAILMVAPGPEAALLLFCAVGAVAVIAADRRREGKDWGLALRDGATGAALAGIPLGILYGVSALTPLRMVEPNWHLLSAAPGVALLWAWLGRGLQPRWLRLAFCLMVTAVGVQMAVMEPESMNVPRWKGAVEAAERVAAPENMPVLVCSDFPEANYVAMPAGDAKESRYVAQLSYYRLSVPVVPMPRALNAEAMRVGGEFVEAAAARHERFLAVAGDASYATLDWLAQRAAGTYSVRVLGVFSRVKVMEFTPRGGPGNAGLGR